MHDDSCKTTKQTAKTSSPSPTSTPSSPSPAKPPAAGKRLNPGTWGGNHVNLEVTNEGAGFEFDCARGSTNQPITLDENGNFEVDGTYERAGPGPTREGGKNAIDVRFTGTVTGDTMDLTVQIANGDPQKFKLTSGKQGRLTRCY